MFDVLSLLLIEPRLPQQPERGVQQERVGSCSMHIVYSSMSIVTVVHIVVCVYELCVNCCWLQ